MSTLAKLTSKLNRHLSTNFSEEWFGKYQTSDLINLFVEAEGRFANSMSELKIIYLQLDTTALAKFDDKVLSLMRRMRNMGK